MIKRCPWLVTPLYYDRKHRLVTYVLDKFVTFPAQGLLDRVQGSWILFLVDGFDDVSGAFRLGITGRTAGHAL